MIKNRDVYVALIFHTHLEITANKAWIIVNFTLQNYIEIGIWNLLAFKTFLITIYCNFCSSIFKKELCDLLFYKSILQTLQTINVKGYSISSKIVLCIFHDYLTFLHKVKSNITSIKADKTLLLYIHSIWYSSLDPCNPS